MDLVLKDPLAKSFDFNPKKLTALSHCVPAKNQPGNVCDFTINGQLVGKYDGFNKPSATDAQMVATARFYREKDGSWKIFYATPKKLVISGETCSGVSACHVSYPLSQNMAKLLIESGKFQYMRIMGERQIFTMKRAENIACTPTIFNYQCTAKVSGVMEHEPVGMFFGAPPKPKFVKETHTVRFVYYIFNGKEGVHTFPAPGSL
ncbi:MAG: hypothetical protein M1537_01725 [Nitrospirae bacterium]|nr:hypothetical protein [Nitrospirota bacterium]